MPLEIRMLTSVSEIEIGSKFFKSVWGGYEDIVPLDIAIASGHAGGYYSGAFDSDGELVAASYAFVGRYGTESTLHSHVTASNVAGGGFALKLHQRDWARERGFDAITWTFDPLVRRNCVFNLEKLGATCVEYLVNFYGTMNDDLNRGEESDRLLAYWPTSGQLSQPAESRVVSNPASELLTLPADIETLRRSDPGAARAWRERVRQELQPAFASGATISRMTTDRSALIIEWPSEGA